MLDALQTSDPSAVIEIESLVRRFGDKTALDGASLEIPRGCVFGLVGQNGAGKTTLIRHLLGLLAAQEGTIRVFGHDPVRDPVGVLSRLGHLSEERHLPQWMRVDELLAYTRAFYPSWDPEYAETLCRDFDLDPGQKVKALSKGQHVRLGLVCALAHRPELLVLDEPSSGLDPVIRRDVLEAIIRTVAEDGRTVLFSSHLLDEVERVADHVAMIHHGKVLLADTLDSIHRHHHHLVLRVESPSEEPPTLPGTLYCEPDASEWSLVCHHELDGLHRAIESLGAELVEHRRPNLDEICLAWTRARGEREPAC
ncbi:MAG: ABC transporter ATP-binding protein [Acidobacteriota bacterium]